MIMRGRGVQRALSRLSLRLQRTRCAPPLHAHERSRGLSALKLGVCNIAVTTMGDVVHMRVGAGKHRYVRILGTVWAVGSAAYHRFLRWRVALLFARTMLPLCHFAPARRLRRLLLWLSGGGASRQQA